MSLLMDDQVGRAMTLAGSTATMANTNLPSTINTIGSAVCSSALTPSAVVKAYLVTIAESSGAAPVHFDTNECSKNIKKIAKGVSLGVDRVNIDHVKLMLRGRNRQDSLGAERFLTALTAVTDILTVNVPVNMSPEIRIAVAMLKGNVLDQRGKLRVLGGPGLFSKIGGRTVAKTLDKALRAEAGYQQLASISAGIDIGIHSQYIRQETHPMNTVISCDMTKAYNRIERAAVANEVVRLCPSTVLAAISILGTARPLITASPGHIQFFNTETGLHQGEQTSTSLYCIGQQPIYKATKAMILPSNNDDVFAFADDGNISAGDDRAIEAFAFMKARGVPIGCEFNPLKSVCVMSLKSNEEARTSYRKLLEQDFLPANIHIHPSNYGILPPEQRGDPALYGKDIQAKGGINSLGAPIGSQAYKAAFYERVKAGIAEQFATLKTIKSHHVAHQLLRRSTECSINFMTRITPPEFIGEVLQCFEIHQHEFMAERLGKTVEELSALSKFLITTPAAEGGAGNANLNVTAYAAYLASVVTASHAIETTNPVWATEIETLLERERNGELLPDTEVDIDMLNPLHWVPGDYVDCKTSMLRALEVCQAVNPGLTLHQLFREDVGTKPQLQRRLSEGFKKAQKKQVLPSILLSADKIIVGQWNGHNTAESAAWLTNNPKLANQFLANGEWIVAMSHRIATPLAGIPEDLDYCPLCNRDVPREEMCTVHFQKCKFKARLNTRTHNSVVRVVGAELIAGGDEIVYEPRNQDPLSQRRVDITAINADGETHHLDVQITNIKQLNSTWEEVCNPLAQTAKREAEKSAKHQALHNPLENSFVVPLVLLAQGGHGQSASTFFEKTLQRRAERDSIPYGKLARAFDHKISLAVTKGSCGATWARVCSLKQKLRQQSLAAMHHVGGDGAAADG